MGRPFANELGELERTYAWARECDVEPLRASLQRARGPLLAIGSGGSFTAAAHAAFLHEEARGELARAATPLDAVDAATKLRHFNVLLVSSGGRNRDALQACEALLRAEPKTTTILTASSGSPLALLGQEYGANVVEFDLPNSGDGFLATNSLLAFCTLLGRAYGDPTATLASSLGAMLGAPSLSEFAADIDSRSKPLIDREVLLVLHGSSSRAAALDVESKFSEAALGSVHVSDYRNFGHGRHHWLAKRGAQTGIVTFVHERDGTLAKRTLAQLPPEVPQLCVPLAGGSQQTMLGGLVAGYHIVAAFGRRRDIDPGRPGVPEFGSRLYSLRMSEPPRHSRIEIAARRKQDALLHITSSTSSAWKESATAVSANLEAARFASLAIDYDGTLCSPRERFRGLRPEVASELVRLCQAGLHIGIATGRGKSIREAIQEVIPETLWGQIQIGYYNGGFVAPLTESLPSRLRDPSMALEPVLHRLRQIKELTEVAEIEPRNPQITIECRRSEQTECVWELVQRCVAEAAVPGVTLVRSSHSIDVLAPWVTKLAVVRALPGSVLRIGDKGRFPGNDFALLDDPLGLSVDEVSSSRDHCWNLLSAGRRGVVGTLEYLRAIRRGTNGFSIAFDHEEL